jgi:hypothetical protein
MLRLSTPGGHLAYTGSRNEVPPMAQPKPKEKITAKQILKLVDELAPEEQAKVRNALLEDQEDIRIALERLAQPGKRWSLEELEQELDLAG